MSLAYADDLLEQAVFLAGKEEIGRPKQASLRRAVSAAYYAVFLEICDQAVGHVLSRSETSGPIGARLRRTVTHTNVKRAARWFIPKSEGGQLPGVVRSMRGADETGHPELGRACESVVALQEERHYADYDLSAAFSRPEAARQVRDAERAIHTLRSLPAHPDRSIFLLGCLFGEHLTRNA